MKLLIGLSLVAASLIGVFAFNEQQQSKLLIQQISNYEQQNSQLLTQIENNSLQKLETAETLQSLQSQLSERDNQLAALSRQLETVQLQIDPDYQQIETRIRQQLTREIQASNSTQHSDPRMAALLQLSELDPVVMGEIFALNAQYGEFIRNLEVSAERKEVVINALQNLITDQNQARTEIIQQMQNDPQAADRGELAQKMRALSDPSSQLDALAYDLSETELDAFAEYQEQQQNALSSFGVFGGTSIGPVDGPALFNGGLIQSGSGQSRAIQIMPIGPDN